MTREEAIEIFRLLRCQDTRIEADDYEQALEMAIQALSQEPTDENLHREREQAYMQGYEDASKKYRQEPCEDAISRQAVIKCLERGDTLSSIDHRLIDKIKRLPSVTHKSGKWIKAKPWMLDNTSYKWECSECEKSERFRHNFCPNCGARMESDANE